MTSEKEAPLRSWQEKVHAALAEAGFEPYEESGLWEKTVSCSAGGQRCSKRCSKSGSL
jgi:hypothetical protein